MDRMRLRSRRLGVESLEDRRMLAVVVDTHLDVVDAADGLTSLREAIASTNAAAGADVIEFDASLAGKTIQLQTSGLQILDSLTVNGLGADQLTVRGGSSGVFYVGEGPGHPAVPTFDVTLSGLTITGGRSRGSGAGIRSTSNLTVVDCAVTDNVIRISGANVEYGTPMGGGIAALNSLATTRIVRSVISDNFSPKADAPGTGAGHVGGFGGGIAAYGTLIITDSLITRNTAGDGSEGYRGQNGGAGGDGGGIWFSGVATISGSTISDNLAGNGAKGSVNFFGGNTGFGGDGGGIAGEGALTITNSLILINSAGAGGAITTNGQGGNSGRGGGVFFTATTGPLTIVDTTIAENNTADGPNAARQLGLSGRGGDGGGLWASGAVNITGSTIAANTTGRGGHAASYLPFNQFVHAANAGDGGGVWFTGAGAKTIVNSTISGNATGVGGNDAESTNSGSGGAGAGLWIGGTGAVSIAHTTIANNATGEAGVRSASGLGGGVRGLAGGAFHNGTASSVTLNLALVAGNRRGSTAPTDGSDLGGPGSFTASYSLIGVDAGATIANNVGNQIGATGSPIDAMLGPLADNGGPTQTHALLSGSPALDNGDANLIPGMGGVPTTDQRGGSFTRVVGAAIDVGAFEASATSPTPSADFDDDGDVDGSDFLSWQRGEGDANGDETSDEEDLVIWQRAFGGAAPAVAAAIAPGRTVASLPLAADEELASADAESDDAGLLREEASRAGFSAYPVSARPLFSLVQRMSMSIEASTYDVAGDVELGAADVLGDAWQHLKDA